VRPDDHSLAARRDLRARWRAASHRRADAAGLDEDQRLELRGSLSPAWSELPSSSPCTSAICPARHLTVSIQNEPGQAALGLLLTPQRYAATAEAVAQRLAADGRQVPLTSPDTAIASFAPVFLTPLLAKPTAGPATAAVAFHAYQHDYYQAGEIGDSIASLGAEAPAGLPPG
jgi:hypothetical protein